MSEKYLDAFKNLAPKIGERARKALEIKNEVRQSRDESWGFVGGDFSSPEMHTGAYTSEEAESIAGLEKTFFDRINLLIHRRADSGHNIPVVFVDFGGMYSYSMCKIALALRSEIESGRLVLVSTSLGFDAQSKLTRPELEASETFSPPEIEVILNAKNFVKYINADAAELHNVKVRLPNGTDHSLHGNIDLMHERFAIAHSKKPDVDLPLMSRELSEDGALFIGSYESFPSHNEYDVEHNRRRYAFDLGLQNILLTDVNRLEDTISKYPCEYSIFVKRNAVPFKLN